MLELEECGWEVVLENSGAHGKSALLLHLTGNCILHSVDLLSDMEQLGL